MSFADIKARTQALPSTTLVTKEMFTTSVRGVGPYCIAFSDGEIVHMRNGGLQKLLAGAPEAVADRAELCAMVDELAKALVLVQRVYGPASGDGCDGETMAVVAAALAKLDAPPPRSVTDSIDIEPTGDL